MRLVGAELLKIRTAPWTATALALVLLLIVGLGSASTSYDAGRRFIEDPLSTIVAEVLSVVPIFALILGILVVTWDYRHGTIVPTYLAVPRRERVLAAKLVVAALLAAALVLAALLVGLIIAEIWIGDLIQLTSEVWAQIARDVVGAVLWGILGAGLGALLQTQVGALITALVWFFVAEFVLAGLGSFVGDIGTYLPGQAMTEFLDVASPGELSRAAAGLLIAGYATAFAALGFVSVSRRDV